MNKAFATPSGTEKFSSQSHEFGVSPRHFKQVQGLLISSLGMGTYLGPVDATTDRLIEEATRVSINSRAVNVIDTAINYRFQKSERAIGRALSSLIAEGKISRDQVFVSTKNGYLAPDADHPRGYRNYINDELLERGIIQSDDIVDSSHCMTVPYLRHELERSRSNLQLETIDLIYLHNSAEAQIPFVGKMEYLRRLEDAFRFYEDQRRSGSIRFYGLATWDCLRSKSSEVDHLELQQVSSIAKKVGGNDHGFRFVQFPFNLAMPEALVAKTQSVESEEDSTLVEACLELEIGAFTSVPLMQGRLLNHPGIPKINSLTMAQSNLQLARSIPGIIAPLVGHKLPEHVEENIMVAKIDPMNWDDIKSNYIG